MTSDSNGWIGDHRYAYRWYHASSSANLLGEHICGNGPDAVWKHNLYTYDASGVRAYINGVLVDSTTSQPYLNVSLGYIGSKPGFGTNGIHGYLDDIFFTSEVLDAAAVLTIYEQGLQGRSLRWQ